MVKFFYGKKRRQLILIFTDLLIVVACAYLSLAIRFTMTSIPPEYMATMLKCLPVDMVITIGTFWIFRLYHSIWSFASIDEIIKILEATVLMEIIEVFYKTLFLLHMPRSYYIFNFGGIFILVLLSRLSIRIINHYRYSVRPENSSTCRTMIVGAGSAGSVLITELMSYQDSNNKVVCIIDDNVNKKGKYLHGIEICGNRDHIPDAAAKYRIDEIIIAMPSAGHGVISEIVELCNETDCRVRLLPSITKTLDGKLAKNIRDVSYNDLLGRDQVEVNEEGIADFLYDKTVMVTGGGGSIGSELCRQIIACKPKLLIIFDIYENNAYSIQMELLNHGYPAGAVKTLIGSVRDQKRLDNIFKTYKPDIIYHAAAHKHVPLMESSPNEAIKNNCQGTYFMAKLADKYEVKHFILISTDKAVRPTNIMGASKRICEMIIQSWAKKSKTSFAAVRFGNVLGSNGSVIPLFLKQIEEGGPVTVTHKDITRFFMTIPEAVSLVLQAGLYAEGGEIYVLDMGKSVRIYDLAESLIKLKGYRPGVDINIEIIGLRPGEKLYEEILMDEEGLKKTPNNLIFIGHPINIDSEIFFDKLGSLMELANENTDEIKNVTAQICDTYTVSKM